MPLVERGQTLQLGRGIRCCPAFFRHAENSALRLALSIVVAHIHAANPHIGAQAADQAGHQDAQPQARPGVNLLEEFSQRLGGEGGSALRNLDHRDFRYLLRQPQQAVAVGCAEQAIPFRHCIEGFYRHTRQRLKRRFSQNTEGQRVERQNPHRVRQSDGQHALCGRQVFVQAPAINGQRDQQVGTDKKRRARAKTHARPEAEERKRCQR